MNRNLFLALITAVLFVASVGSFAADKPQTVCPVSGEAIDKAKSPHVDYQGQRVYFCCDKCPVKFRSDPDKYFEKMASQGVVLESAQKECPVTGEEIDPKSFTDYKGRRVYFCCDKCIASFKKDPVKYLNKLPGEQPAPAAPAEK